MFPDIQDHMRAAQSRFLFFKMDTVKTTTLVRGTASGQTVFIGFQPGVDVMVRLAKLPDVITEPVFAVDLYILAFTATYQKASRLPLVHLLKPDGSTRALLTSGSDGCHAWATVPDGVSKHDICAMQLWGLLQQFPMIPRHPITGVAGDRCAAWGQRNGPGRKVKRDWEVSALAMPWPLSEVNKERLRTTYVQGYAALDIEMTRHQATEAVKNLPKKFNGTINASLDVYFFYFCMGLILILQESSR